MNISNFIAKRYFTSKKSRNFIQILSIVSMLGVAIGTAALVIVLSVFNGLEGVLRSVYASFDPDLRIELKEGKSFQMDSDKLNQLMKIDGVQFLTPVIEDKMVLSYRDNQSVVVVKGVDSTFLLSNDLEEMATITGELILKDNNNSFRAILGAGVAYELGILVDSDLHNLELLYPRNVRPGRLNTNALRRVPVKPSAIFNLESTYDQTYVIAPIEATREAMGYRNGQYTSLEIDIEDDANPKTVEEKLEDFMGSDYDILNGDEQHAELLRSVKIEKLFAYIAITFITLIASFNVFFTLTMLAIDKRKDVAILYAMGTSASTIRNIYLKQGFYIAISGSIIGTFLGIAICLLQQEFGLVTIQMASSMVQAYPVKLIWNDLIWVALSVFIIAGLTSFRPAIIASRVSAAKYL